MLHRALLFLLLTLTLATCSPEKQPVSENAETESPVVAETATPKPQYAGDLRAFVSQAQTHYEMTAFGAVVASPEGILDLAVAGQRRINDEARVQPSDAWHIGSNTKALTALLYARLVDAGKARWGATLPELFPDLAETMDPAWHDVTAEDLMAHRSGIGTLGPIWLLARRGDDSTVTAQRAASVVDRLTAAPKGTFGAFEYSNLGYIVLGAAIERILAEDTGETISWETAMQDMVFSAATEPGARLDWGTGPPTDGLEGHRRNLFKKLTPVGTGIDADNPAALGPAGTLHVPLASHALLATEFLKPSPDFLPAATREKLWTPYPDADSTYAMGWGINDHAEFGRIYTHSGSNTMWLSLIIVAPELDRVVILNTNQFSRDLSAQFWDMAGQILSYSAGEADSK